ncbi:DUF397 domain-containing protein [Lentzea guizhouensis]|uniref:DUF397 domain-containing protein n=1 Tax=Lentzea guizhouensis TaxID=1586287 RepID=UPI0008FF4900|nr:DUF397 domain-containing protein [Lentzea guizhouensis]
MADEKPVWRKSSHSGNHDCVELTFAGGSVWVRNTRDRDGQTLAIPVENWTRFLRQLLGAANR